MADVYINLDTGEPSGGGDDGTSWDDAHEGVAGLNTAMAAANNGDDLWVQGTGGVNAGSLTLNTPLTDSHVGDPVRIIGVKDGTSATPPVASDLIPGLATGDATRAYEQTAGDAPPIVELDTSGVMALDFGGVFLYGIVFRAAREMNFANGDIVSGRAVECSFESHNDNAGSDREITVGGTNDICSIVYENCRIKNNATTAASNPLLKFRDRLKVDFLNCEFGHDSSTSPASLFDVLSHDTSGIVRFIGCDLSLFTYTNLFDNLQGHLTIEIDGCKLPSSFTTILDAAAGDEWQLTISRSNDGTGITASLRDFEKQSAAGTIVDETTAVRTGGANDGDAGGFSYKMTPDAAGAVTESYKALISPWLVAWPDPATAPFNGSATRTFKVYFANSLAESSPANDFHNDEVWMELHIPSAGGTARLDVANTKMALLATPADIASDGSTWGTGANNAQILTVTAVPDFEGPCMARVHFARGAGTPDSIYLDPLLEIT